MRNENKKEHVHIDSFNPDVTSLEKAHQDFKSYMELFDAGKGYNNFSDFIKDDAVEYKEDGDGVTYVVWNVLYDENGNEVRRDIVSYYTLAATAIPYEDRIRLDEEERLERGQEYDSQICGISALEIKMFAVDEKFQDMFFEFEGEELPISAWIMRSIIDYANNLLDEVLGFKAIFYIHFLKQKNFIFLMDLIL